MGMRNRMPTTRTRNELHPKEKRKVKRIWRGDEGMMMLNIDENFLNHLIAEYFPILHAINFVDFFLLLLLLLLFHFDRFSFCCYLSLVYLLFVHFSFGCLYVNSSIKFELLSQIVADFHVVMMPLFVHGRWTATTSRDESLEMFSHSPVIKSTANSLYLFVSVAL